MFWCFYSLAITLIIVNVNNNYFAAMINHPNVLVEVLDGNLDPSVCQVHRNALKMNCYLLCHLMDLMEDEISRANAASAVGGKVSIALWKAFRKQYIFYG